MSALVNQRASPPSDPIKPDHMTSVRFWTLQVKLSDAADRSGAN